MKEIIVLCLLQSVTIVKIEALLTVSPLGAVCPDSIVSFTCYGESVVGPGSHLQWTASLGGTEIIQFTFFSNSQPSFKHYHGLLWNSSVLSSPFRSILSTTTVTYLNGTVIECDGSGIQAETLPIVVAHHPGVPTHLHVASIVNTTFSAAVQLEWAPPSVDGGAVINQYTVTLIDSDSDYSLSQTQSLTTVTVMVTNTTATITLLYNTNYIIHVAAVNCAGSSLSATLESIAIVNCSIPRFAQGIVIEPYNSTTEGSIIFYSCDVGLFPNETQSAVCQRSGIWSEPINMNCTKYSQGGKNTTNLLCSNEARTTIYKSLSITTQQLYGQDCECLPSSDLVETCCSRNDESDSYSIPSAMVDMTFAIGLAIGSFFIGAFCGTSATLFCWLVLSWTQKKGSTRTSTINNLALELNKNPAYETVSIRH